MVKSTSLLTLLGACSIVSILTVVPAMAQTNINTAETYDDAVSVNDEDRIAISVTSGGSAIYNDKLTITNKYQGDSNNPKDDISVGMLNALGNIIFNANTSIYAIGQGAGTEARAISIQSDHETNAKSYVESNGNNVVLRANGGDTPFTLYVSGHASEFVSNSKNLGVYATTAGNRWAQAITSQYGANVTLNEDTNTNVMAVANAGAAYGIAVQNFNDASGTFTSKGNLTVRAQGRGEAYGVYAADGGNVDIAQIKSYATSSTATAYGVGVINNTTNVNIGTEGTKSVLSGFGKTKGYGLFVENGSGAILNGDIATTGSTAGIFNDGTVTIAGGTTNGAIIGDGTLNIADGAMLDIGGATIKQDTLDWNGKVVAKFTSTKQMARINANNIVNAGTLNLTVGGTGVYKFFTNASANITFDDNDIFDFEQDGVNIIVKTKSVDDIAENLNINKDTAQTITNLSNADFNALNNLSLRAQQEIKNGNASAVDSMAATLNPETAAVAQSVSGNIQNAIMSLTSARMSGTHVGRAGGDARLANSAIWAQGLYNKTDLKNQFNGDTMGLAAGVEADFGGGIMVGLGYAFSKSDVNANTRTIDIDSDTLFIYGQYKPAHWYANATLSYSGAEYSESGRALGMEVNSNYNVHTLGAKIATGYEFAKWFIPEVGMKYMNISVEDYNNSLKIKNSFGDTNYLTAMIGAKSAFDIKTKRNWIIQPEIRYGVKYDLISDDSNATVTMPGVESYVVTGDAIDPFGAEAGIGLTLQNQNLDVSLNYDIEVRKDYTSQTGMLKFRYDF